jgi:hypothetical protein
MAIIRWTTATFIFEFQTIQVSDITDAYFVVKQWDNTVIEKDLTSATVDTTENKLSWTLTQAEAGLLTTGKRYSAMCDWLTSSGTRGRSKVLEGSVENSGVNEVIS